MGRLKRHQTILATLATTGIAQAILAASGIGAARILGVDDRGKLALFNLLPTLLVLLGTLGLPVAITYFIAREPDHARSTVRALTRLSAILALVLTVIDAGALAVVESGQPTPVLVAAAVSIPLVAVSITQVLGQAILQGQQRYKAFNWCRTLPSLTYALSVGFIFITGTGTLLTLTAAFVATTAIVAAFTWWLAIRNLAGAPEGSGQPPRVRTMVSFGLRAVLGAVYPTETFQLDQASVGLFLPSASLGLYVVAVSFTNLPRFIAQSFGVIAYPRIAATKDTNATHRLIIRFTLAAGVTALLVCVVLEATVGYLIPFVYGPSFAGAVTVTRILLISSLIVAVRRVLADGLRGAGYPTIGTAGEAVALVFLIPLLAILVSLHGLEGAAIAVCISSGSGLVVNALFYWHVRRHPEATGPQLRPRPLPSDRRSRRVGELLTIAPLLLAAVIGVSISLLRISPPTLLICGTALALILPIVARAVVSGFDPFEPCFIFALSYGVMFVARPIAMVSSREYTDTIGGITIDFRSMFTKMLLLGLIGAASFGAGYLMLGGRRIAASLPRPPARNDPRALFLLGNTFGFLGCLLFGIFASSSGGIGSTLRLLLAGRSVALTDAYRSSSSYLSSGQLLLIPAIVLLLAVGFRNRDRRSIAFGLGWLVLFCAIQIPLGDRTQLLPVVGGLVILPYLAKQTRPRLLALAAAALVALFASAVLSGSRQAAQQGSSVAAAVQPKQGFAANASALWHHPADIFQPILRGPDGAEAPDLAAALTVIPSRIPYTYGASTIGDFFTRIVPRNLWAGKPLIPRARVIQKLWSTGFFFGIANPEFSVLLYPYMDAGIIGVVLLMLLFGALARAAYEYLALYRANFAVMVTYAVSLPVFVMAVRDSPVDVFARSVFFIVPLLVAFRASSIRRAPMTAPEPKPLNLVGS